MSDDVDTYELCRSLKRYSMKNGYTMKRSELGVSDEFLGLLERNDVIRLVPLYEGGPKNSVILTAKGRRMADSR